MKTAMKSYAAIAAFFALPLVSAHMEMMDPPALESKYNPNAKTVDYSMTSPLNADGSNYPCKGYNKIQAEMTSVATWEAGSSQTVKLTGGAIHDGGSCQLSISEDGGSTFKVIKSFLGNCPSSTSAELPVDIPKDVKNGDALFAWSWNNKVGNREFYMNCAAITITGGGSGLDSYPDIFVANLGTTTCAVPEGIDVDYPNPGTEVDKASGANLQPPTGDCGSSSGSSGSGSSSGSASSAPASSAPASTAAPSSSAAASVGSGSPVTSAAPVEPTAPAATSAPAETSAPDTTTSAAAASGTAAPVTSEPSSGSGSASSTACSTEGVITCNADGTWSMCGSGIVQNMGAVPNGETCANGVISKRQARFSPAHMRRRHGQF